jgi:hypothetical protein
MTCTVPDNPKHAAVQIVLAAPEVAGSRDLAAVVLPANVALLLEEGCFTGLCRPDATAIAAAISRELADNENPVDALLNRARDVLAGTGV